MFDLRRAGVVILLLLVSWVLSGCVRARADAKEWSAVVKVQGNSAAVSVEVPGWQLVTDYHPHFALDDGPEVMPYTPTYVFPNLSPGRHRVRVVIADPSHRPIAGMLKIFELEVK